MNRRFSRTLATLAVVGLAAGCGSSDRPRELSVDDVQPCDLLDSATLNTLGVKAQPSTIPVVEGADEEGATCEYDAMDGETIDISVVTNHGIDRWTDGSMESTTPVEQPRIHGYRTIRASKKDIGEGPHDMCTLYVDVAGGQSLRAETGDNGDDDPPSCEIARNYATPAVSALANKTA